MESLATWNQQDCSSRDKSSTAESALNPLRAKSPMIVMPTNNTGSECRAIAARFPGRIQNLISPGGWRQPVGMFAIDNGRFPCWRKGSKWNESAFLKLIDTAMPHMPRWIVVPDVVGNCEATLREWDAWEPRLRQLGVDLAFAVQDGATKEIVPSNADIVFVGGTTDWKWHTAWMWCHAFPRVHLARVNTEKWLWCSANCGAESCDGTGWFRGDKKQTRGLVRYLEMSQQGLSPAQLTLEFARTFGGEVYGLADRYVGTGKIKTPWPGTE